MRTLLVLIITLIILAVQFHFGLRKKKLFGSILPIIMTMLFVYLSVSEKTTTYILTGVACIAAIIIVWVIGYAKSSKYEKETIDRMKAKDL
jgi:uncharacterized membrane protein